MSVAPEEQIGYLLKQLQQAFRNLLETRLRHGSAGLSFAHLVTLDLLGSQPGLPGAQLARRINVTAQTMNQMLKRLEKAGEIERQPHPESRRADRWFLRPRGRNQLLQARAAAGPVMTQMLSLLQPDEVAQLRRYLELCVQAIESSAPLSPAAVERPATLAHDTRPVRRAARSPATRSSLAKQQPRATARYSPKRLSATKPARR